MTFPSGSETSISYGAYPHEYVSGLQLYNSLTNANTSLTINTGVTIDSTDTYQMIVNNPITINALTNGLNGLDIGTLAAGKVYAVYVISSPISPGLIGGIISLSFETPSLPVGYENSRLIGFITTATNSATFLLGTWTGGFSNYRIFTYDTPLATSVTAGNATTFTNVNLIASVPYQVLVGTSRAMALIQTSYVGATAGNTLELQQVGSSGYQALITCQVATVPVTTTSPILVYSVNITSVLSPAIAYKVTNASDSVAISVIGYSWWD